MKIAFASYGHTRTPDQQHAPRNSVHLTFWGAYLGVLEAAKQLGAEVKDYSPLVGKDGVRWDECGRWPEVLEPCDVLYCQAGVSRQIMRRARELNPACKIILQRDSTHARTHHRLMKAAQKRHGLEWHHFYDDAWNLEADEEEYALADHIFVLSRWVQETFEEHGLGDKTVQFAPQTVDVPFWSNVRNKKQFHFVAVFVGQLGVRKGTFDLLEAWRNFASKRGSVELYLCGMPEHGSPPKVEARLQEEIAKTPYTLACGYISPAAMRDLYGSAHVLVAPSVEDGGTMVGPEAALSGCAIIATKNAGIDILEDGKTGYLIEHSNPVSIEQALERAHASYKTTLDLGENAQARAELCGLDFYSRGCTDTLLSILR
jgi:glycosyltransferase involved in cell wall biosynthesis